MSFTPRKPYDLPFFEAVARCGQKERSAELAGVHPNTIRHRERHDPEFAARLHVVQERYRERSVSARVRRVRMTLAADFD